MHSTNEGKVVVLKKEPGLLFVLVLLVFLTACKPEPTPVPRSFTTIDLLIPLSDMPPDWVISSEPSYWEYFYLVEGYHESFVVPEIEPREYTHMFVYNFELEKWAYETFLDDHGGQSDPIPEGWLPFDIHADQYDLTCVKYQGSNTQRCWWEAQYEEFIVIFHASLVPGYMSLDDYGKVVKAIDTRMVKYLGIQSP